MIFLFTLNLPYLIIALVETYIYDLIEKNPFDDVLCRTWVNVVTESLKKWDKSNLIDTSQLIYEFITGKQGSFFYILKQWYLFLLFQGPYLIGIIIQSKPKIMYSRNFDFTNLDLFSCQDLDNYGSFSPNFNKPMLATGVPTNVYTSLNDGEEFFFQKSTQNLTGCYQISFQKDFMKEHQAVFEKELQNYMESFRIYSNKVRGLEKIQKELLSKPQEKNMSCVEFISANKLSFSHEQIQNFVKKFNSFDKLCEFLNFIVSNCPKAISLQFIHIAKQLLEKYESVKIEAPTESELLKYASEIASAPEFVELINLKGISLKNCRESTDLIEKSKKFMEVYCATTMLVIAQYFQNPYSADEKGCFKRQLSFQCSEDQQEEVKLSSVPAKKRKYQFQF